MNNVAYHVICRGTRKENIFLSADDYTKFFSILKRYKKRYRPKLYAYCLMTNHIHLLLDPVSTASISKFMHGVCLSYAMYYNSKYGTCGHLWQNRYKSFVIQNDQYLINVASYIEYNPIRAAICSRAEEYQWSSYKDRISDGLYKIVDDFSF
ncbi:MAG TPA: transposase [Candidatus Omnitrophota bacterium]|nr:transposase [Candidatus Omnitrophota bacterium]HPS21065.1 transposase [Candidatus Omnitrophota bacterium]